MTLKIPTSSFLVIIIYMYVLWLIVIILHILSYIRLLQSYYRHCFYNYQSPSRHLMTLLCSLQVHQSSGTIPFSGNIPTVWVKSPFNIVFFLNLQYSLCISPFHIHVGLTCMPMITSMVTLSSILFQFSAVFLPLCIASHAMRMANFKSSGHRVGSGGRVTWPLVKTRPFIHEMSGVRFAQ